MITKLSHATVFVFDQAASLKFYTEKLGFTERMNADMGNGERWITVSPPNQPELELVLFPVRFLFTGEKTCIDCHKGIAHKLPDMRGVPGWQ